MKSKADFSGSPYRLMEMQNSPATARSAGGGMTVRAGVLQRSAG